MKPITNYKRQEQDYRKKMSACNVSYRLKRSGPLELILKLARRLDHLLCFNHFEFLHNNLLGYYPISGYITVVVGLYNKSEKAAGNNNFCDFCNSKIDNTARALCKL